MKFLRDLWDPNVERTFAHDGLELLRYRSNLLGADLRITNFGGGNTSSKLTLSDPLTGEPVRVLAIKGSGGDLGSIETSGFALLYLDRFLALESIYRGEDSEDEMTGFYPLCAFGASRAPASIDTPLHAFLPFAHVDHLHPDWAIALAASANGRAKLDEFNQRFGRKIVWMPWQRPGFELGLMMRRAVEANPGCDGILLGSHGLFTWGATQRECYASSIAVIDQLGEFVAEHRERAGPAIFGGPRCTTAPDREDKAAAVLPFLRGQLATLRRSIAHYDCSPEMLEFVNALDARDFASLGTSCPDHFIRTRIRPMYVEWDANAGSLDELKQAIRSSAQRYRSEYTAYYRRCAQPGSPPLRDPNPSVVLIPGLGMFTFARNKTEARITGEFYINAEHVIEGAVALGAGDPQSAAVLPQAKTEALAGEFAAFRNYVALPPSEAFRIEYWTLEEAKIRRMPQEKELSRRIFILAVEDHAIARAAGRQLAAAGAHLLLVSRNGAEARQTAAICSATAGREAVTVTRDIAAAVRTAVLTFGGVDGIIAPASGCDSLCAEAARAMNDQGLSASIVLLADGAPVPGLPPLRAPVRLNTIDGCDAVLPDACAEVIGFLAGDRSAARSGQTISLTASVPEVSLT